MKYFQKTKYCCVYGCLKYAVHYNGFLIKSRDKVGAGFCEHHKDTSCPKTFNKKDCYGIYNKSLELI